MNGKRDFFEKLQANIPAYPSISWHSHTENTQTHTENTQRTSFFPWRGYSKFGLLFCCVFHVFHKGVFQILTFCSRVGANWPRNVPKSVPKSTQNGPPNSAGELQNTFQKKGPYLEFNSPLLVAPGLQKDTPNGHRNLKKSTPERFFTLLKKHQFP